ncbi:MAG TPA: ABC transporter permease DevC [Gemmataceae bacterium]|nr:ABC transporter permease DevC [Gemmataceae bacterium]
MAPLRLPLALRILLHTPGRLAVSIAGIVLAVVLMFSQAGFRNAMFDSQTELIHHLNGDLFLVSRLKYLLYARDTFPRRRLEQVRACPGVQAVYPLYMETTLAIWKNPVDGGTRPIRVLAFNLDDPVLDLPEVRAQTRLLRMPNTILFDDKSRDYFGQPTTGTETELSGRRVHVMGTFQLGTDFVTDGNVLMSDRNFLKFFPDRASSAPHLDRLEIGLVRLTPGTDLLAVQRELRETLPDDVKVLTKAELAALEVKYWKESSAIGYIFSLGMAVGFVIGIIICYQILFSNVSNYLPQFATLKAMGFTNRYLVGVVLQQGFFLAILGFIPAVGVAQLLFWGVSGLTGLLMFMTIFRIAFILLLTVAMCMVSGIIAVRGVIKADPAEVFR